MSKGNDELLMVPLEDPKSNKKNQTQKYNQEVTSSEGGWGWVIVFSAFVVYFIVFGALRCQSVLFIPIMMEFEADYTSAGLVAAISTAGVAVSALISTPLMMRIGHRRTIMIGGVIACIAAVSSAFSPNLAVLYVTAGILTGIGLGISFIPSPVIIGFYFKKRRSLATNMASMGGSIGTFALCPLNGVLIDYFSLRGYYLVLGGIFLNLAVAGALMRPVSLTLELSKSKQKKSRKITNDRVIEEKNPATATIDQSQNQDDSPPTEVKSLFKSAPYIVYCLSQFAFMSGFFVNQLYIVPFAQVELGISQLQAPLVMSIAAAVELLSKVVFGILGDIERINRLLMFACVLASLAVCALIIPFTTNFETLALMAAVTGFFQGGFSGISIVILSDIVGLQLYGPALGISTLINGIGALATPPLVGIAVDRTEKPSTALIISAVILFVGAALTFAIQAAITSQKRSRIRAQGRALTTSVYAK